MFYAALDGTITILYNSTIIGNVDNIDNVSNILKKIISTVYRSKLHIFFKHSFSFILNSFMYIYIYIYISIYVYMVNYPIFSEKIDGLPLEIDT